jgi:hypothetical protein
MLITEKQVREIIRKNLIKEYQKERKILKEDFGSGNYQYDIIGNSFSNEFLKEKLTSKKINLNAKHENIKAITDIKIESIDPIDLNNIWNVFNTEILQRIIGLSPKAAAVITDSFKELEKNRGEKVFDIFEKLFPLQTFKYASSSGATDLDALAGHINNTSDESIKKCHNKIYSCIEKAPGQTFNTGKGEYLCVLLTKGATTGGSEKLDIVVGNDSYDMKQITPKSSTLKVTLSGASGVKPKKMEFIRIYSELGKKLYDFKAELKELGVDQELIDFVESSQGITGMGVAKKTKEVESEEEEQFLGFETLMETYLSALSQIRKRTYGNLNTVKNSSSARTDTDQKFTKFSSSANKNVKNKNIDESFVKTLNDVYRINLFQISENKSNRLSDQTTIASLSEYFDEIPGAGGVKILNDKYNIKRKDTCFEIDKNYFPVILPMKEQMDEIKWNALYAYSNSLTSDNCLKNIISDYHQNKIFWTQKGNGPKTPTNFNSNQYKNFRDECDNYLNSQYLITDDDFKKFKNEEENASKLFKLQSSKTSSNIGEFVIEEPIDISKTDGEFVVDISFYKNKKKRHIDTLHSEDLNISGAQKIKKGSSKEDRIAGSVSSSNKESKLDVHLQNVISDRDEINKKVKSYELVGLLQPHILEKIYGSKNTASGQNINIKQKQNNFSSYDITSSPDPFELTDKSVKRDFKEEMKKISNVIGENNILGLFFQLYEELDSLEKQIKKHYAQDHHIMVFKENSSKDGVETAYSWTSSIISQNESKGIIRNIVADGVLCEADPAKYDKARTLKLEILTFYEQIKNLTLEIQDTAQR